MSDHLPKRHIIHMDMDAFYPSVEVLDNPDLKGRPVIVGGSRERGVVSSASYEARKFGIHSAQPIATAMRLCPEGIFLGVRMNRYKEVSERIFEIFRRFTPLVEPLSIDEAFLDVTGSVRLFGRPEDIAKNIKDTLRNETGLTVSAGLAASKFVAKIASDMGKPDGLTVVEQEKVREFLDPLPIIRMWGVGKVTMEALSELGIRTFHDLSVTPLDVLEKRFGRQGLKMHQLSMGIDERDVETEHETKSIGHEDTFSRDIKDVSLAKKELLSLANRVARRMRKEDVKGRTVTLKIKYNDFSLITRSLTLPEATDDAMVIYAASCELLMNTLTGRKPVRLLGISLSKFKVEGEDQLSLFQDDAGHRKERRLHNAMDSIYERFGDKGLQSGSLVTNKNNR